MPKIIPLGAIDPTLYGIAKRRATMMENGTMSFVGAFENELGRIVFKKVGSAVHAIVQAGGLVFIGVTYNPIARTYGRSDFAALTSEQGGRITYNYTALPLIPTPEGAGYNAETCFFSPLSGDFILFQFSYGATGLPTSTGRTGFQHGTLEGTTGSREIPLILQPATEDTPEYSSDFTGVLANGYMNLSNFAGIPIYRQVKLGGYYDDSTHDYTVIFSREGILYEGPLTNQRTNSSQISSAIWTMTLDGEMLVIAASTQAPEIIETYAAKIEPDGRVSSRRVNNEKVFNFAVLAPSVSSKYMAAMGGQTQSSGLLHWVLIRDDLTFIYNADQRGTERPFNETAVLTDIGVWFQFRLDSTTVGIALYNLETDEYTERLIDSSGNDADLYHYEMVASPGSQKVYLLTETGTTLLTKTLLQSSDPLPAPLLREYPPGKVVIRTLER